MKNTMKNMLVVLVILSTLTTAVNAGNIGPAVTNIAKTVEDVAYQVTVAITSPTENQRFGNTSVDVTYETTNASDSATKKYSLNGGALTDIGSNPFTVTGVDNGASDGGQTNTVLINVTDPVNGSAEITRTFKVDVTAPGQISGITSVKGTNYVNWTWINPTNTDFNNTIVNVTKTSDSSVIVPDTVVLKPINYFNATGLSPNTEYTISVKTEDDAPAP